MYPYQTVKETLSMAAKLRLPNGDGGNEEYREVFVASLIEQLGLVKASDTIIGDEKVRGVSGGERKRTNLGIELISDPRSFPSHLLVPSHPATAGRGIVQTNMQVSARHVNYSSITGR